MYRRTITQDIAFNQTAVAEEGEAGVTAQSVGEEVQKDAPTDSENPNAAIAIAKAHEPGERYQYIRKHTQAVVDGIDSVPTVAETASDLFVPLLDKVQAFVKLVDALGTVHPYIHAASGVLLAGVKVVIAQYQRDQAMIDLFKVMDEVYQFVLRGRMIDNLDDNRKRLLTNMSTQTTECASFIQSQAKVANFGHRAVSNIIAGPNIDSKIQDFIKSFRDIRECFTQHTVLNIDLNMVKLLGQNSEILATLDLDQLKCIHDAGRDSSKQCLEGTRTKTTGALLSWLNASEGPNVCFLLGGAGSGKSSIAHSMGQLFHDLGRLGSFLCFKRDAERPLNQVIRTIARNLGYWNPAFHSVLADVIHANRELKDSVDINEQWRKLIVEPLKKVKLTGPVLVVIDAFDESGSQWERQLLLKVLTEGAKDLPATFRILITSRLESDVADVMGHPGDQSKHINRVDLGDYEDEARSDIARYVRHELSPKGPEVEEPLDDEDIQLLANKAEGLFQWAATACRRILESFFGSTLKERLYAMLEAESSLDGLYREILEGLFNPILEREREKVMERFRTVMSQILCASSPLSIESLEEMRGLAAGVPRDVALIVRAMGSLLWGVHTQGSVIRPHHTSFRDFLLDESRSREWFVKLGEGHKIMVLGCVRVLNKRLAFNMCGLEDSCEFNDEIDELDARIAARIPQSLSYAAGNWQDHLPRTALPSDLQQELDTFLKEKLLFWFELLSLLGVLNRAAPALEAALAIYQPSTGESCKELLKDAIFFIRRYAVVVALSAVHVYLSALPFSPKSSLTRRTYLPLFPALPVVEGLDDDWPPICAVLSGHMNWVCAVACSPDGRCIASGSSDKTVRVWDVETGATIHTLYCSSSVHGVAFSPDGYRIAAACGDRMVRVWDSATGDNVCDLVEEHESDVVCVAYSPDGNYLVSGGDDGRICLWSTESHLIVRQFIHGGRVRTVAFSPTGRHLASGGDDRKVRVWNTDDGHPVGYPLKGHTGPVLSVLFSLDGQWIISGSDDATIRIWDIATQQTLHTVPQPGAVMSLSLSPDGRRVVSGSQDGHVLVWNLQTQLMVGGPLVGHSDEVRGVSFSPDDRHIVSGSKDRTVRIWSADADLITSRDVFYAPWRVGSFAWFPDGRRILSGNQDGSIGIWDASTGQSIRANSDGHKTGIVCIKFSPNGCRLATASQDKTLHVWDSVTLQPLGEPLRHHWVTGIDFLSPDGYRMVSCSDDRYLYLWDVDTLQCNLALLVGHESSVGCVAWSPDGTRIASGSVDQTVRVWDPQTGGSVGEPFRVHNGSVLSVSWSSDSRYIMTSSDDSTIRFWDVQYHVPVGEPLYCLQGAVYCARYSPDGQTIISAGRDRTIRMWDTKTREPVGIALPYPFPSPCYDLAFSPDGRRIFAHSGQLAIVFDVETFTARDEPPGCPPSFKNLKVQDAMEGTAYHDYRDWDGWVRDANGSRVMWVPEEHQRFALLRGRFKMLGRAVLSIDFANASYGLEWHRCYCGLGRD